MIVEFVSMKCMKELYVEDTYFVEAWKVYKVPWIIDKTPYLDFHIPKVFLFKNQILCIPWSSLWLNIVREMHSEGFGGHFGVDKTTLLVNERYFWHSNNKDVKIFVECYRIC